MHGPMNIKNTTTILKRYMALELWKHRPFMEQKIFCRIQNIKICTKQFFLALGLIVITTKPLKLGLKKIRQRQVTNSALHYILFCFFILVCTNSIVDLCLLNGLLPVSSDFLSVLATVSVY